jgi:hypothetical protein
MIWLKRILTSYIATGEYDKGFNLANDIAGRISTLADKYETTSNTLTGLCMNIYSHGFYAKYLKIGSPDQIREQFESLKGYLFIEPYDFYIPGEKGFRNDIEEEKLPDKMDYFTFYCDYVKDNAFKSVDISTYEIGEYENDRYYEISDRIDWFGKNEE